MTVAQLVRQLGVASTFIVLARYISPAEFGTVTLALVIVNFFSLWADLGSEPLIARSPPQEAGAKAAAFAWRVLLTSVIIALLVAVFASLIGKALASPEIEHALALLAAVIPMAGAAGVLRGICASTGRFGVLATAEVVGFVAAAAIAVSLAVQGNGVLALQAQVLVSYGASLVVLALPTIPTLVGARHSRARREAGAARGFAGFIAINFWARNADNLLVGRFLGLESLGLYERAYMLMYVPATQVSGALGRVMVPVLAQSWGEREILARRYIRAVQAIAFSVAPLLIWMSASASELSVFIFGPDWHELGSLLAPLAAAGAAQSLSSTVGWLYQASGNGAAFFRNGLLFSALTIVGICIGILRGSPQGVAMAYAVTSGLLFLPIIAFGLKVAGIPKRTFLHGLWPFMLAGPLAWLAARLSLDLIDGPPALQLGISLIVLGVVFGGVVVLVKPEFAGVFRAVKHMLRGAAP